MIMMKSTVNYHSIDRGGATNNVNAKGKVTYGI